MSTNTQNNAPVSSERAEADERKDFAKWYYREHGKSISTFCKFGHSDWNKTEQKLFKVWAARASLSAPAAAQPDVTQQTLDDVMAGIPARDAEIEALQKENLALLHRAAIDAEVASRLARRLFEISAVILPDTPIAQHDISDLLARVKRVVSTLAQQVDKSPETQEKTVDKSPDLQGHASVIFAKAVAWADARVDAALTQPEQEGYGSACDDADQAHYELVQALRNLREAQQPVSGADGLLESPTRGMSLGQRIAHVGGRENAQGYIEFGSPMAVDALIQHILRDLTTSTPQGAFQARYRMPGGKWSSWGAVTCGVKGHEQELRYLETEGQHIGGFDAWIKREYPHLGPIGDCVAIAREAWSAALAQQDAEKVDAERWRAYRASAAADDAGFLQRALNAIEAMGLEDGQLPSEDQIDAAIDAARKEQA
ncbi:hypothetical protein [Alcaligenes faecalis]|uniref:hypothetical protein n=1 Tax=Alcaligenes faecalis TaxID=511 RepID=UPI0005A5F7F9|nr:hypothetical protein [Alcaligenes faecalis]ATI00013.1 hypothetical protein CPY64_09850 [Alcaligenes faecalis]AYZ92799.1 hypothetical protein EGY22_15620 [Alcaligenes faecalis]MCX5593570.1 hypothetical protein [Alcaligenes faecalis]QQC31394.1 hypothetical protein I6H81_12075 [Alcaligenes faecalis]CAJ0905735.1 DarA_N domain-containing protein [Alcaligenes faecalis subsp. faecalis]